MSKPINIRRSNEQRRNDSLEAVLSAARHLFVTQGYRKTTIDQIARQAGLTKGAIYFYFKDKQDLLLKLIDLSEEQILDPVFQQMRDDKLSATGQLTVFLNRWIKLGVDSDPKLLLLPLICSIEAHGDNDAIESRIVERYDRLYKELERVIALGQELGEFDNTRPVRELAAILVSITEGLLLEWYRRGEQLDGKILARLSGNLILNNLLKNTFVTCNDK